MNFAKTEKEQSKAHPTSINIDSDNTEKKTTINYLHNTSLNSIQLNISQKQLDKTMIESQGDYVWLKLISKGTFGTVYKVEHKQTGDILALKRVYMDPQHNCNEGFILKELKHPNLIGCHHDFIYKDKKSERTFLNIIMDYVPLTLNKVISFYNRRTEEFPRLLGKVYAYQLFRALAYLRNKFIIHRDIKPSNILIRPEDQKLMIADFGSAKKVTENMNSVSYICSRYYRAPELILGEEKYQYAIDIWAVGCVITEMFIGTPIFAGKNTADQLIQIIKVLGTPQKDYLSELIQRKDIKLPKINGCGLNKKIENVEPLLIDLIQKTFIYDPDERIRPLEALLHPYFDELRVRPIYLNGNVTIDLFDFGDNELGTDQGIEEKLIPQWYRNRQ